VGARLEPALLLSVAYREPVLDELDPRTHQHPLELRAGAHEVLVLLVGAEAHDPLDAGPVVPAAVEKDHLAGAREVLRVTLEVPLRRLPLGGGAERYHSTDAGIESFDDALDHATLSGGIPALEDDHNFEAARLDEFLHQDQLALQTL